MLKYFAMNVLCIFVSVAVAAQAHYHERIGIPLAARIKTYEDKLFANPQMESRITHGDIAPEAKYPFMVGLLIKVNRKSSLCGSSIVTATRLVTAAHCLDRAKHVKARLGSMYLYHGGIVMKTRNFTQHPKYKENAKNHLSNDIAIVNLRKTIDFSDTIKPVRLPAPNERDMIEGEFAVAVGWGITSDAERDTDTPFDIDWRLREVIMPIMNETVCEEKYMTPFYHGKIICTDGADGKAICDGDSGGPLVIQRSDEITLIGVTSNGFIDCEANWPSIFMRVARYKRFILGA